MKILKCDGCKEVINSEFYFCKRHKKSFCFDCATNKGEKQIAFRLAVRCKPLPADCIYEKRGFNDD